MPKATDIVGTIRVPEEYYGRFWNFMRSMPSAEFTPVLDAKARPAVRTHGKVSDGSTGKCMILTALGPKGTVMKTKQLTEMIVEAGKSPNSLGNMLHELIKAKHIKRVVGGYSITAAGLAFCKANCSGG